MMRAIIAGLVCAVFGLTGCATPPDPTLNRIKHDRTAFTEGLTVVGDRIVESTGLVGESRITVSDLNGVPLRDYKLPAGMFGEGIAVHGNRVWVLTWTEHQILTFDFATLTPTGVLPLETEGWGACFGQGMLWTSDGSNRLYGRNPDTGEPTVTVTVALDGMARLNELECLDDGTIWANLWQTNDLVLIDSATGQVTKRLDLSVYAADAEKWAKLGPDDVANGVAVDPAGNLLVTGKRWPYLYRIPPSKQG